MIQLYVHVSCYFKHFQLSDEMWGKNSPWDFTGKKIIHRHVVGGKKKVLQTENL